MRIEDRPDAFTAHVVQQLLGSEVVSIAALSTHVDHAARLVTLQGSRAKLVVKLARPDLAPAIDFGRTEAVMSFARSAGVPVPAVVAVDTSLELGPWQFLVHDYTNGSEWRLVRPRLDDSQLASAYRELAAAAVIMHSIGMENFGELHASGRPMFRHDVVAALARRAELRIVDQDRRSMFLDLIAREASLLSDESPALCHDDLHHSNVLFRPSGDGWKLAAIVDWDKAWSGPPANDIARMSMWDDMTGPSFWQTYRAAIPERPGDAERALIYQLLWCLEYGARTPRHLAETAALSARLGLTMPAT